MSIRNDAKELESANQRLLETVSAYDAKLSEAESNMDYLQEQYVDAVRSMLAQEDVGWNTLGGRNRDGFTLQQLHNISIQLREWTTTNPLLVRGIEVRCSYLFGAGYEIVKETKDQMYTSDSSETKIQPRFKKIIEDNTNQNAVFSITALAIAEKARYTDGQFYVIYNSDTSKFQRIPFTEISDAWYNPDNSEEVWYYQRSYTRMVRSADELEPQPVSVKVWYPTDSYTGHKYNQIAGWPVAVNTVMIDDRVNLNSGDTFGSPDAFAASPWALAYSSYLRDGTKVLSALAEWAWKLSPKTRAGAAAAKGRMAQNEPRQAGKTAVTDMDMQALPKANAVDLATGRPLAAQVATALGISVVLLLSDPGSTGSYGTAQTLSDPTIKTMTFRQSQNTLFLRRCLRAMGMNDYSVVWGKMATDADYREMQTLAILWDTGLFGPEEIRDPMAKLAKLTVLNKEAPDGVLVPNNAISDATIDVQTQLVKILAKAEAMAEAGVSPTTGQAPASKAGGSAAKKTKASTVSKVNKVGQSGGIAGAVSAGNNDLRDAAKK